MSNPSGSRLGGMDVRLAPTLVPTTHDLAWAAGIFEGEGHARRSSTTETVIVGQTDRWLLERLRAFFGGSVGSMRKQPHPRWNESWVWVITGARARGFLQTIYGLMSPRKQAQIRKALGKGN